VDEPGRSLRILTLNLWGVRGDWLPRRDRLRKALAGLSPDLVTFQECIQRPAGGSAYDQAADILPPGYVVVHQRHREVDGQGVTTASRWPVGAVVEDDLQVTDRTADFACTSLVTEIRAPAPFGRLFLVNNLPSWQLDFEHERMLQAVRTARLIEELLADSPAHVVVAGDFDADPTATSIRFWTGRHALDGTSVCYRDAWEAAGVGPGWTFVPSNPYSADWDWPFRRIDYVLVRCGRHGGPTLAVDSAQLVLDLPETVVSDHYGLCVDLTLPESDTAVK
jgi:endonuclease/exonuclease/phosphatase family metal-dependent hydrolase